MALAFGAAGCATSQATIAKRMEAVPEGSFRLEGTWYAPLDSLESAGIEWEWDPFLQVLSLKRGLHSASARLGADRVLVDGEIRPMPGPLAVKDGILAVRWSLASEVSAAVSVRPSGPAAGAKSPLSLRDIHTVVIDAGHGGHDPGAIGFGGMREKDLTLELSKRVKEFLERYGTRVIMTRDDDRFIPLRERPEIASDEKADFFISIHGNSNRDSQVRGLEVYYLSEAVDDAARALESAENLELEGTGTVPFGDSPRSRSLDATVWDLIYTENRAEAVELSRQILKSAEMTGLIRTRGVKAARFAVLKGSRVPAILVEVGYLSNSTEGGLLQKDFYKSLVAEAIANGVQSYREEYARTNGFSD